MNQMFSTTDLRLFPRLWFLSISSLVTVMPHSSQKILQRRTHFHKEMKSKSMCCESISHSWKRTDWILSPGHSPKQTPTWTWKSFSRGVSLECVGCHYSHFTTKRLLLPLSSTGKVLQTAVWKNLRRSVKSKVTGWGRVRGAKQKDAFSQKKKRPNFCMEGPGAKKFKNVWFRSGWPCAMGSQDSVTFCSYGLFFSMNVIFEIIEIYRVVLCCPAPDPRLVRGLDHWAQTPSVSWERGICLQKAECEGGMRGRRTTFGQVSLPSTCRSPPSPSHSLDSLV